MVEPQKAWLSGLRQRVLLAALAVTVVQAVAVIGLQSLFLQRVRGTVVQSFFLSLDELGAFEDCGGQAGPVDDGRGWYTSWPLDAEGRPLGDGAPLQRVPLTDRAPGTLQALPDAPPEGDLLVWWTAQGSCTGVLILEREPYPILATETDTVAQILALRILTAVVAVFALVVLTAVPVVRRIRRLAAATEAVVETDFDGAIPQTGPGDELDELGEAFNAAAAAAKERLDALDRRDALLRRGLADLGHDLRTPVATLKLTVGQLDPAAASTADLRAELEYLGGLVANFESLLRLGTPHDPDAEQDVDLGLVVERLRRRFDGIATERGVSLVVARPDEALVVRGDGVALEQAVGNLVQNAIQWATGNVAVLAFARGDHAVLEVRDDGPGIDADEVPRLAERRTRGADAGGRGHGFGLGLSIADAAARRHGGSMELQPLPEGGTRAELVLPRA